MKTTIDPQEAAELDQLYKDYLATAGRTLEALRTRNEAAFLDEETKQAATVRRMKEILGTTGQPWNA